MNKEDRPLLNTRIRPMEPKDFDFIQSLAAELPTFTIPPKYVLWFISHYHPDYCRVLESIDGNFTGYLIAMPTTNPANGIAIWQVAAAPANRGFALEYFSAYLRDLVEHIGVTSISFTLTPDPATLRLIRSLAREFFNSDVSQLDPVPNGQAECEFRLSIGEALIKEDDTKSPA